jgi:alkylation response protein AidB-like acyl-CoA dehydrogenase
MPLDLRLDPALAAFRAEVAGFLADAMRPDLLAPHLDPTDLTGLDEAFERDLLRRCGERGWLGISVPSSSGGGGRPPSWQAVFGHEAAYADAPAVDTAIVLAGAPVLAHGTPDQLDRLLPGMLDGSTIACCAYSEPDAGSDLTMIRTTARPAGGGWVIDGVKAHVTAGHKADWCVLTAVTDPDAPPRRGMSMFVVPLDAPGVLVRRRPTLNGWTLAEITFAGVEVGGDALLGQRDAGWRQMGSALLAERSGFLHLGFASRRHDDLAAWLIESGRIGDDDARRTLARLRVDLEACARLSGRVLDQQDRGEVAPGATAMAKVAVTELLQELATESVRLIGRDGAAWAPLLQPDPRVPLGGRAAWERLDRIRETISVGANELQRTTIARTLLAEAGR